MKFWIFLILLNLIDPNTADLYEVPGLSVAQSSGQPPLSECAALDRNSSTECRVVYNRSIIGESLPWPGSYVTVDLNGFYNIKKVVVSPSLANATLSRGMSIYASGSLYVLNETPFYSFDPTLISTDKYVAISPTHVWARYITFYKFRVKEEDLAIAEVLVYTDYKYKGIIPQPTLPFVTTQNHVYNNLDVYKAYNAIDGRLATCAFTAQEIVANRNETAEYTLDLMTSTTVQGISVTNNDQDFHVRIYRYFAYLKIYVHDTDIPTAEHLCLHFDETVLLDAGTPKELFCVKELTGRRVSIHRTNVAADLWHRHDALAICELLVLVKFDGKAEQVETSTTVSLNLLALIVGCVLGGLLLILLIILIVLLMKLKRNKPAPAAVDKNFVAEANPYNVYVKENAEFVEENDKNPKSKTQTQMNKKIKTQKELTRNKYVEDIEPYEII